MEKYELGLGAYIVLLRGSGHLELAREVEDFQKLRVDLVERLRSAVKTLSPETLGSLFSEQTRAGGKLVVGEDANLAFVFPPSPRSVNIDDLRKEAASHGLDISDCGRNKREIRARIDRFLQSQQSFKTEIQATIPKV